MHFAEAVLFYNRENGKSSQHGANFRLFSRKIHSFTSWKSGAFGAKRAQETPESHFSNACCIQARRWPAAVRLALRRFPAARYIRMIAFTASAVVVCGISSKPIMPSYPISSRQANTAR